MPETCEPTWTVVTALMVPVASTTWLNFAAIHFGGEILRLLIALELKGGEDSNGHNHQTRYQPMAFQHVHDVSLTFRIRSVLLDSRVAGPTDINPEREPGLRIESLASWKGRKPHHLCDGTSCVTDEAMQVRFYKSLLR